MNTSTLRSAAALLGAMVLSVTLGGQPALAQTVSCPCLTGAHVDGWFPTPLPSAGQSGQLVACVDEPTFTTFDYSDGSKPRRSMYIDLRYQTRGKQARCVVDLSNASNELMDSSEEITDDQAKACRQEILSSQAWSSLGCPSQ